LRVGCLIQGEVHGGGVVAALGPGPLATLGVGGLSCSDLAEQLVGAVLVEQGQQLLPGGQLEQVDQSAGTVAQQDGCGRDELVFYGPGGSNGVPRGARSRLSVGNYRRVYRLAVARAELPELDRTARTSCATPSRPGWRMAPSRLG
jgi:hypothetical protein